jgi:hypothetical protein
MAAAFALILVERHEIPLLGTRAAKYSEVGSPTRGAEP